MYQFLCLSLFIFMSCQIHASPMIRIERVPDNGIQPRLVSDNDGRVHLLYFKKTQGSKEGRLYYRTRNPGGKWSQALQVSQNYNHNDAIAKASMTIDADNNPHVVWFVSNPAGYWYSRLLNDTFEPPASLVSSNLNGVEAEAAISSFEDLVTISWHAGDLRNESERRVYSITSADRGASFGEEIAISNADLGACACCGLASSYLKDGTLNVAYRSAIEQTGRHMQLLSGSMGDWQTRLLSEWTLNTCPVSSNAINGNWLVFETKGHVYRVDVTATAAPEPVNNHDGDRQKHPAIAVNSSHQMLVTWGEGPGYFEGGELQMVMFDAANRSIDTPDTPDKSAMVIPKYSVAATAALKNGEFLVVY